MIIQVDGVRLFALEAGRGEPALVLIHGNGGAHAAWHRQISYFSPMTRVVAIDLRGHGESGRDPSGAYSHATLASDISAWFKALEIASAVVVGWSVGGSLAVQFATEHPELTAAVVLVDNNPAPDEVGVDPRLLQETLRDLAEDFAGRGVRHYVDRWFPETGPEIDRLREWCYEVCRRTSQEVIFAIRSQVPPGDRLALYRRLAVPTLILQGGASPLGGRAMGELLARTIPGSRLHVFEGKGHAPFLTTTDEFNQVLEQFFVEVSASHS